MLDVTYTMASRYKSLRPSIHPIIHQSHHPYFHPPINTNIKQTYDVTVFVYQLL
jgi:hypothetical protein